MEASQSDVHAASQTCTLAATHVKVGDECLGHWQASGKSLISFTLYE
jgi:hypothetical protein